VSGVILLASTGMPKIAVNTSEAIAARLKTTTRWRSRRSAAPPRSSAGARTSMAAASAASRTSSRASAASPRRPSRKMPSGAERERRSA
jgi:hypothetical protein